MAPRTAITESRGIGFMVIVAEVEAASAYWLEPGRVSLKTALSAMESSSASAVMVSSTLPADIGTVAV